MYLNQQLISSENAQISIFDHGYLYGVGLFETFRTYNGFPFLLGEHLKRLELGCQQVGMHWRKDIARLQEQISHLLKYNQVQDGYFRYNVSAGAHPIGLPAEVYTDLTEALFMKELPAPVSAKKLVTVETRRNTPEGSFRLKSHHYLNNIVAKREAPPDAEGVFLTSSGKVAEGIVSNIFFVKQGVLYTPSLSTGILNGITRNFILKMAQKLQLEVEQGEYDLSQAKDADEVFVTNSIQEIVPIYQWDEHLYDGSQESISRLLKDSYDRYKYHLDDLGQI